MMNLNRQLGSIKALGKIEGLKNDVRMLRTVMDSVPLWRPGTRINKQCDEVIRMIGDLEERFERKLVVTIIGPSGSGKSTMLNSLVGIDDFSEVGHLRPTTKNVVVFGREKGDADQLSAKLGKENVESLSSRAAAQLEHVLIIDTPDTDSMEMGKHIPLVLNAIAISDILICIFDSENPKRKDHIEFLAPYVRLFDGDSLVVVINKCDRLEEEELKNKIAPEFLTFIKKAWERTVQTILCISARRHMQDPQWDPTAVPKHDFDQFEELQNMIFGTFNHPGYIIDRRMENAKTLRDFVFAETGSEVKKDLKGLQIASDNIRAVEKKALEDAVSAFLSDDARRMLSVNVLLYQKLSQHWMGPVGWLISIWARILIFGSGLVAMLRFGNPFRQLMGIVSSLRHFKDSQAAVADVGKSERVNAALGNYRLAILREWPDIAETMVKGRFDPSVRKIEDVLPDMDALQGDLETIWTDSLDNTIEGLSKTLSGFLLQIIFNLPVVGILCHVGWMTAQNYFIGNYFSSDFFLHAFLTIAITLFLSFFFFQVCVRLAAGSDRIIRKAFNKVKQQVEQLQPISRNLVGEQLDAVLGLDFTVQPDDVG